MNRAVLLAILSVAGAAPAYAQASGPSVTLGPGATLLNVTAEGRAERTPDLANFNAGVVTHGRTAGEALAANSARMEAVIAALRRVGVADRDIQTATLSLQPQYSYPQPERPDREGTRTPGEVQVPQAPSIIGYEARNSVAVRGRRVENLRGIIDALIAAGANQVDGPYFTFDTPEAVLDEARGQAVRNAAARADTYAKATGMRVVRMLSITESGGYFPAAIEMRMGGVMGGLRRRRRRPSARAAVARRITIRAVRTVSTVKSGPLDRNAFSNWRCGLANSQQL